MTEWITFHLGLMIDSCASLKPSQCIWWALYKCLVMWQTLHSYIGGQHSLPTDMLPHSPPSYASYERVGYTNHRNCWRRPCCHMEIPVQEQWGTNPRVFELLIQKHRCDMHEWQHYSKCQNNHMTSEWDTLWIKRFSTRTLCSRQECINIKTD